MSNFLTQGSPAHRAFERLSASSKPYAVATSGGADSLALAWLARHFLPDRAAHAFIIDHGLQPDFARVAAQSAEQLTAWGYQVTLQHLNWRGEPPRQQALWRKARQRALLSLADEVGSDCLLLGHQADDQAELTAMRLLQGSGLWGLAGMAQRQQLCPQFWLERPLLSLSRAQLRAFAQAQGLRFSDDPSNENPRFLRVRLRRWLHKETAYQAPLLSLQQTAASWRQSLQQQAYALPARAHCRGAILSLPYSLWGATPPLVQAAWLCAALQLVGQRAQWPNYGAVLKALPRLSHGTVSLNHSLVRRSRGRLWVAPEATARRNRLSGWEAQSSATPLIPAFSPVLTAAQPGDGAPPLDLCANLPPNWSALCYSAAAQGFLEQEWLVIDERKAT